MRVVVRFSCWVANSIGHDDSRRKSAKCSTWNTVSLKIDGELWNVIAQSPLPQIELAATAAGGIGELFGPVRGMAAWAMNIRHLHEKWSLFASAKSRARVLYNGGIFCRYFVFVHGTITSVNTFRAV